MFPTRAAAPKQKFCCRKCAYRHIAAWHRTSKTKNILPVIKANRKLSITGAYIIKMKIPPINSLIYWLNLLIKKDIANINRLKSDAEEKFDIYWEEVESIQ